MQLAKSSSYKAGGLWTPTDPSGLPLSFAQTLSCPCLYHLTPSAPSSDITTSGPAPVRHPPLLLLQLLPSGLPPPPLRGTLSTLSPFSNAFQPGQPHLPFAEKQSRASREESWKGNNCGSHGWPVSPHPTLVRLSCLLGAAGPFQKTRADCAERAVPHAPQEDFL